MYPLSSDAVTEHSDYVPLQVSFQCETNDTLYVLFFFDDAVEPLGPTVEITETQRGMRQSPVAHCSDSIFIVREKENLFEQESPSISHRSNCTNVCLMQPHPLKDTHKKDFPQILIV